MRSKVIAILGMHRSGTSMLAGSLEQAGLYLGDVNTENVNNEKGSRESNFLMQFHEEILTENRGSWALPPYDVIWSANKRTIRDFYIHKFRNQKVWGFKDPRTVFLAHGWKEAIPNLQYVGIFRHPSLVAQSLAKRNGFSFQQGIDLWVRYNRKLIEVFKLKRFPIIEFVDDTTTMQKQLQKVADKLELKSDINFDFLEDNLIHQKEIQEVKWEAMKLYNQLKMIESRL